eukprot:gene4489-4742_t
MHQLTEEVTFRERELFRLREALDKAQLDAKLCRQKQETTDAELAKVSQASSVLEVQLRALQRDKDQLSNELQTSDAARAAAEGAAATSDIRAATAEALLSSTRKELEQLRSCHNRLLADQQAELERLRVQVQAQASELSKEKSTAASREQELLREVHAANSSLIDARTAAAAEKGNNEVLAGKASHLSEELEAARKQNQQLQVNVEELEQMLAESEAERRMVRTRFLSLGDQVKAMIAEDAAKPQAAAAELRAVQQQLQNSQALVESLHQQVQQLTAELSEAQDALIAADKVHQKLIKKHDRNVAQLADQQQATQQQVLLRSAEVADLQAQLQEASGRHQGQAKVAQDQELELHNRYLTALDALSSSGPGVALHAMAGGGAAAAVTGCEGRAGSLGSLTRFETFDARLRKKLAQHVMEERLLALRKELSADYKLRLDSLEAEWSSRSQARITELEATHTLKLQQADLSSRLDKERLEAKLAETAAGKQRLDEQLTSANQELDRLSREASHLRAAAEEAKDARKKLQLQLDEANSTLSQLQAVVCKQSSSSKGDRDIVADLMTRLEQRTAERNEALQAAAGAEQRLKVLESEKLPLQQRRLQETVDAAEAGRIAAEGKLRQALAEAAKASSAAEEARVAAERQVRRVLEEKARLMDSLNEAEVRSLSGQLREARTKLGLLQEDHAAMETVMAKLKEERQQLMTAKGELEDVRAQLSSQVALSAEDQRRLSLAVQGLEITKAGLARRLSVLEAEKQVVMRTNELRAASPSMLLSPSALTAPSSPSEVAAGSVAMASVRGSRVSSPVMDSRQSCIAPALERPSLLALAGSVGGFGSFAGFSASKSSEIVANGLPNGAVHQTSDCFETRDLDNLVAHFNEERQVLNARYDTLDAENGTLRQQLASATRRANELSIINEQLRNSLEQHQGIILEESKTASKRADQVLSDVQHSSSDLAKLNSWLQGEFELARKSHKEALASASTAQQQVLVLEAKLSEQQRSAAAALKDAEAAFASKVQKLQMEHDAHISGWKAKVASKEQECTAQLAKAVAKGVNGQLLMPPELLDMGAGLLAALPADASIEDAAAAVQALLQGMAQHIADLMQQVLDLQQDTHLLLQDGAALAVDFQMCATNLQSLVATVAFSVPISEDVQQGLNAKDPAVFDEQLAALHQVITGHLEAERAAAATAVTGGPLADLQQQLEAAHAQLAEASGTIKQMKLERQEEVTRFEDGLHRARAEAADGAEMARKESLAGLRSELQAVKSELVELQQAHTDELTAQQEVATKQLAAHVKTADAVVKELEATALNLQEQLAAEVERADAYDKELKRLVQANQHSGPSIKVRTV